MLHLKLSSVMAVGHLPLRTLVSLSMSADRWVFLNRCFVLPISLCILSDTIPQRLFSVDDLTAGFTNDARLRVIHGLEAVADYFAQHNWTPALNYSRTRGESFPFTRLSYTHARTIPSP